MATPAPVEDESSLNSQETQGAYLELFAPRMEAIGKRAKCLESILNVPPDFRSAAGGFPPPEFFPSQKISELVTESIARWGPGILQYGRADGFYPLRQASVAYLNGLGVRVSSPEQIIVTSSSQAALDTVAKLYISPGDGVAVEGPTYVGALAAFDAYGARYRTIQKDASGMMPDDLKEALRERGIKFVYINPTFGNPSGDTMPASRREEILQVLEDFERETGILVPIVEDDPYSKFRYSGEPVETFQAIDLRRYGWRRVIYMTTFSKTLAPALRLGEVAAPPAILKGFVEAKNDLCTGYLVQAIATVFVEKYLGDHIKLIVPRYKDRRDAMLDAMKKHFPDDTVWTKPDGGMFIWWSDPGMRCDALDLLEEARKEKVAFVPGIAFFPNPDHGLSSARLNFTQSSGEDNWKIIEVLGKKLKQQRSGEIYSFSS